MKKVKLQTVCIILPQIIYLVFALALNKIHFATNDDLVILDILSGRYGEPSPYANGTSVIFGYIQNILFKYVPLINWIGLAYILVVLTSFVTIDIAIVKEDSTAFVVSVKAILLLAAFFLFINHFTFTTAAYAGCIAGTIWGVKNIQENDCIFQRRNILSFVLILSGIIIRPSVIQSLILILGFYALYIFIKYRKKGIILFCVLCYFFMYMINSLNNFAYSKSPIQSEYNIWNSARAGVTDHFQVDEIENKLNWSESDFEALYSAFLYDKELFSVENLKLLHLENRIDSYLKNLTDIFSGESGIIKKSYEIERSNNHFIKLFLVVLIISIILDKKDRISLALVGAGGILTSLLFYIIGRSVYRVLMPGYIFGILLLLLLADYSSLNNYKLKWKALMLFIVIGISGLLLITEKVNQKFLAGIYKEENEEVISYLEENSDILYLPCDSNVFALGLVEPVLKYRWDIKKNVIGNWDIYSEPYYQLMKHFQVEYPDRLVLDIPDNDKVQLITLRGLEVPEFVSSFIEERNGFEIETQLEHKIEDTGYGEWRFYSVQKK